MINPIIHHDIELVQILVYLSDCKDKTNQYLKNTAYINAIQDWFDTYKDHPAVHETRRMIYEEHFTFARPHKAALMLDALAADDGYSHHKWANLVKCFSQDSKTEIFFEKQAKFYDGVVARIRECDFDAHAKFIESYFKTAPVAFNLIISPIDGNYGFVMNNNHYVIQCMPWFDENGNDYWRYDHFAKGIAHEYAHCFVSPVVEAKKELLDTRKDFFDRHKSMPSYYNVNYAIINEYWVRAFAIRFMETHRTEFPDFDGVEEISMQKESFQFLEKFLDALKIYEKSNLSFSEFYYQNIEMLLS